MIIAHMPALTDIIRKLKKDAVKILDGLITIT